MREVADAGRVRRFMEALGRVSREPGQVYLTGGATAVLEGWRAETADVDLQLVPDSDRLLAELPAIKEALHLSVELAAPSQFIPELPGWRERSRHIVRVGRLDFFHYDFYAQALAKISRGLEKDRLDVEAMLERGLIEKPRAWELFRAIEAHLYRYPALDPVAFRRAVVEALGPDPS